MKQFSSILIVVLFVLVGILFYLQFKGATSAKPVAASSSTKAVPTDVTRIAYFEMDSLQANYKYFKDALNTLKGKEQEMNNELAGLERSYQKKVGEWQQKGAAMSQSEADAAQRENAQLQQNYQARKQQLEESFAKQSMEFKKDIKKKIEVFLEEYNREKKYSYVLSYEPDFIFLKDSSYNITGDLISGLNASYQPKK